MKRVVHPCGSLPVSGFSMSVWYCYHHMAYWATVGGYTQHGDQEMTHEPFKSSQLGPFDTWDDIVEWMTEQIPIDGLAPPPPV